MATDWLLCGKPQEMAVGPTDSATAPAPYFTPASASWESEASDSLVGAGVTAGGVPCAVMGTNCQTDCGQVGSNIWLSWLDVHQRPHHN